MTCPASLLIESQTILLVTAVVWMAAWTLVLRIAITPAPLAISSYGLSGLAITAYGRPVNILPFAISLAVVLMVYLVVQTLPRNNPEASR